MPRSRTSSLALWAMASFVLLLCASPLLFSHHFLPQRRSHVLRPEDASLLSKRAAAGPFRGPAHQNPAKAPPTPIPEIVDVLNEEPVESGFQISGRDHLAKRADGPLRCDDAPCIDGSCCGKNNICGYGPDYCGDGCISQCNATAMCGEFSENADMPCGMKLCCSATGWCGTTEAYCHNADPLHNTLPCQAGYGSCSITGPPSCAAGGGTTNGRTIGYYQSWNVRDRACNKVSPSQLNTTGYTHLFYSFASIDPGTYKITPAHSDDPAMMKDFTALSKDGKLQTWIAIGGFDFSDPGKSTHTTWSDLCSTKERRAAFIASVKEYMDTYGFQGVDIDWEYPGAPERGGRKMADTRNLATLVREMRAAYGKSYGISLTLAPDYWYLRWFDGKAMEPYVDFFGFMAYDLHGSWDADVLTLGKLVRGQADIREISSNTVPLWFDGLNPSKINFGLAMYGRGYTLADPSCNDLLCSFSGPSKPAPCTNFGGVMSLVEIKQLIKRLGLTPKYLPESMMKQITWDDQWIGYDDEETFAAKKAFADSRCFGGTMVWSIDFQVPGSGAPDDDLEVVYLAPEVYSDKPAQCTPPCVMVFPPTALPSATTISIPPYTSSIVVGTGSGKTTMTITVKPPAITTSSMGFFNINATSGQLTGTLRPTQSVDVPPVVTTVTDNGGLIYTRTLYLPPWPLITLGPPPSGGWSSGGSEQTTQPAGPGGGSNPAPSWPPATIPDTPWPGGEPTAPGGTEPTVWPPSWELLPVEKDVDDEGEDDDDDDGPKYTSSCKLWFFGVCIKWEGIVIGGWEWNLPTGIWGPGPPPLDKIKLPPNIRIQGKLPPWPKITIGPGGKPTYPPKPADCEPTQASLCLTTSSFGTTVSNGATRTTATQVKSTCATITGCNLRDVEATKTGASCAVKTEGALGRRDREWWECDDAIADGVILPRAPFIPEEIDKIRDLLKERKDVLGEDAGGFEEFTAVDLKFTAYFFVKNMGTQAHFYFNWKVDEVKRAYFFEYENRIRALGNTPLDPPAIPQHRGRRVRRGSTNDTLVAPPKLTERDAGSDPNAEWHLGQISTPGNVVFKKDGPHAYDFDDSLGQGQTIFILDDGFQDIPSEFGGNVDGVLLRRYGNPVTETLDHGTLVAAFAGGKTLGVARKANLVHVQTPHELDIRWPIERFLEALINVANRCAGTRDSTVVNMSWGIGLDSANDHVWQILKWVMQGMEWKYGTMFVVAAGNDGKPVQDMPALFAGGDVANMIVVGGSTKDGKKTPGSDHGDLVTLFAPGNELPYPANWPFDKQAGDVAVGTSFAAPMVAGLVAYIRAHPDMTARSPGAVRAEIIRLSRNIKLESAVSDQVKVAWNGQSGKQTCVTKKRRGLLGRFRRQDDSCPLPDNPGSPGSPGSLPQGPPVTFTSGPAGPTCTATCGKLCSGFWCGPNPTGPPPELPSTTADAGVPTNCISSTTTVSCNGAGVGKDCHTSTRCLATGTGATGPFPTLPPNGGTSFPANCISTTTWTSCGVGGGVGHAPACVTGSACAATQAPEPTKTTNPKPTVTWTPPSGFPSPKPIPSVASQCAAAGCRLYPSIMDACDVAAQEFLKSPDGKFGTGGGKVVPSVCVDGTDKSNGVNVGCKIRFFEEETQGSQCIWTGSEAAQWYSSLRGECPTCGWLIDDTSGCGMLIKFMDRCSDPE